jgi:hypothetical protein
MFRGYWVTSDKESKGKFCVYYGSSTGEPARGFSTIEDAKHWAEHEHYASEMQPYVVPDSITDIQNWFKAAKPEPTDKDRTTQLGCVIEEFAELMESVGLHGTARELTELADEVKSFTEGYAKTFISRISRINKLEALDATSDITVTVQGFNQLMGFDGLGAQREVIRSNNSKMVKGKFQYDENGKIAKPESYSEPDLTPFVSNMQNLHKGE